ncbi:MAG: SDR family oxidoreductase [Candidatus Nanopelagicales bacterium]|nr:SDR family oxidoreductase [Candidatus Nanopelagicales bacterium]
MELDGFTGRGALVTGGARGIGREIAERLRDLGAQVTVGDLSAPDIPGCTGIQMDVTSEESVRAGVQQARDAVGSIDILVLNAGIFVIEPFEETTLESWQRSISVNLTGAFLVAREVLPGMRQAGYGRVVSIGSSAGITGGAKSVAAYGASKAGVMALAKAIASEYAPHGVTSNALAPTLIETDMVKDMADMAARIPVGRLGQPAEVADLVAFLCSAHAGFITGAVVDINGGFLIR